MNLLPVTVTIKAAQGFLNYNLYLSVEYISFLRFITNFKMILAIKHTLEISNRHLEVYIMECNITDQNPEVVVLLREMLTALSQNMQQIEWEKPIQLGIEKMPMEWM